MSPESSHKLMGFYNTRRTLYYAVSACLITFYQPMTHTYVSWSLLKPIGIHVYG